MSVTFEDGTAGAMSGLGGEIAVVPDPTGAGKGKVLSLHYRRDSTEAPGVQVDRNRHIDYQTSLTFGQTLFFKGDVYMDVPSLDPGGGRWTMRKLLYWQPTNGSRLWEVLVMFNDGFKTDGGYAIDALEPPSDYVWQGSGGIGTLRPKTWHTIEKQTTFNSSPTAKDGINRVWIDGKLVFERTDWVYATVPGATFGNFAVGDQTQNDFYYDEYRYWDNITFSLSRVP